MKLCSIEINNFHCFRKASFIFAKKATILIGKNGSGKTSLINAIKNSLSIFFSNNSSWGYSSLGGPVSDLGVSNVGIREIWHDDMMNYAESVEIKVSANFMGKELCWSFKKDAKEKAYLQTSLYKDVCTQFMQTKEESGRLPLMVCYSDRFPHIDAKLTKNIKEMLEKDEVFNRSWGYYHWDYVTSCAEIWQKRFIRIYRQQASSTQALNELDNPNGADAASLVARIEACKKEIEYIKKYIREFTNNEDSMLSDPSEHIKITNLMVDGIDSPYIVALFADGHRCRWDELPAGYERIFNIVFDLAYRSFILNEGNVEPSGIVVIDELDLHLHPSMEQDVLRRFQNAFPEVQLIASTHSPLVVSNFKQDENNFVIQMGYADGKLVHSKVTDSFGMDYDMTLSMIMGTEPRNAYLKSLGDMYVRLKMRGKDEKAQETLNVIKGLVSEERFSDLFRDYSERVGLVRQ